MYFEENGKLPVGVSAIALISGINSANWIAGQRVAIKNGIMNKDKQEMLANIGITYGKSMPK